MSTPRILQNLSFKSDQNLYGGGGGGVYMWLYLGITVEIK